MEEIISAEELEELKRIEGEIRGIALKGDGEFVLKEIGKEGLEELEKTMRDLGFPIEYGRIKGLDFYPLRVDAINLLVITRLFNFDNEKIQELGRSLAKASLILKFFTKYFVSIDKLAKKAPEMWRRNYTVGNLKVIEINKEKKYGILRVENFQVTPQYCQIFSGYFSSVLQMIVKSEVVCEERKCIFRGDSCHEFFLKWE